MSNKKGENKPHKLSGGEILHLVKDPGGKWMIRFYECQHGAIGGFVFRYLECLPAHWENLEFESEKEAVAFAQQEINEGKVPGNRRSQQ